MDASDLQTEKPITRIDWQQVVLNGGPPCFFVEGPQYCGRAKRWPGHGNEAFHDYVSLDDLLATVRKEEREAAFKEMIELAQSIRPDGSINFVGDWNRARKQFIALLEAALTEK